MEPEIYPEHSYYNTVVNNPAFQAWVKYNESLDRPLFDTPESIECGIISPQHFQTFLDFYREKSDTINLR